ncbi:hypothetical protein [Georgenia faecalis]|uniref:hypothetical protein n=1 Tax=Georgenia faecalis TaxID=2483799 RepID=UPI000FDB3320|nr:hypothetical protein [Georgenia faecalis]
MASEMRSGLLRALRSGTQFDIPTDVLNACLHAEPRLLDDPPRIAAAEALIEGTLVGGTPIPAATRGEVLPVLGNIAEAVVEVILEEQGWQPVGDDASGFSSGHGIDLLMLDSTLERLIVIEVKSTIQPSRWPRLAAGRREQLTPEWFDAPSNEGMVEWGLGAGDVHTMVAQIHLRRRRWRACLANTLHTAHPLVDLDQLASLEWLTA